mgnify:CR=1 FL=1
MTSLIATDQRSFDLEIDPEIYSLEVCKKACYALLAIISCNFEVTKKKIIIKAIVCGENSEEVEQLKALLLDELLDYSLRASIAEQTENVRNVILSNAFSKTKLVS